MEFMYDLASFNTNKVKSVFIYPSSWDMTGYSICGTFYGETR